MKTIETALILDRENILNQIKKVFETRAIEGHIFGSVARGDSDPYSDLDIWVTFKDTDFPRDLEKRLELYKQVGQVIHLCEPPQNAPSEGVFSTVIYKTSERLMVVDFYLCPQQTSFTTTESKKLFGDIDLPIGETGLNPQKISVPETYRIDFLICFIFNSIKKIIRKNDNALGALFREYGYLKERYNIDVEPLSNTENTFMALESVIGNVNKVSNVRQKDALKEITEFIQAVTSLTE